MGNRLISYKNKLWKVIHDFKCTNSDQPFTLQSGKYLFICKGATSGEFVGNDALKPEMGGLVMGIQNVTEQTTFHAVVGGKGGDLTDTSSISLGGFNGGMPGSKSMTPAGSWRNGCGGGGASDIRLLPYDPDEYPTFTDDGHLIEPQESPVMLHNNEYIQLEYIRCVGNRRRNGSSNMAYLNTGYNPKISSKIVYDGVVYSTKSVNSLEFYTSALFGILNGDSRRCAFFARIAQDGEVGYERYDKTKHSLDFTFDQRMEIVAYDTKVEWFVNDISMGNITLDDPVTRIDDLSSTLYLFGRNREGGLDCYGPNTQMYSFKIYEVDETNQTETLAMNLLPVQRVSDNTIGMFDTVSETFLTFTNADQGVIPGPKKRLSPSLYSRIMVAGGAGGLFYKDTIHGAQFGGGVIGSFVWGNGDYEPNCEMIPNQTNGYAFGYGQRAVDSNSTYSWSPEGSSSGGGGWYGGYARIGLAQTSNMHMPGGGGSGYVLTSSSYRPDGYTPDAKYNFTDTFMSCGQSHEGEVIIASLVTSYSQGDIIEFPSVASMQSIDVSPGKYKLKCYGGDGGYARYFFEAARGGYSEGIINILSNKTLYVNTGGSGNPRYFYPIKFDIHSQLIDYVPNISYNGGGTPINGTNIWDRVSGGGATDIRIDGDTLNHRIIVAGGAGSSGGWQHVDGGVGGGLTGGSVNADYSKNAGPGTQTSSPQSTSYPDISGSFGQGGHGMQTGSRGYGGSGGGGWYGGSGSRADYDYQYFYADGSAGAGGSGYVLTEISHKPSGYQVDNPDYYLQDASTTSGGNSLPLFETKATVEVLELLTPIIAHDNDGYKYYDQSISRWRLIQPQPSQLTKDVFDAYPDSMFMNDTNLMDEYQLYMCDENEETTSIGLLTTPHHVRISTDTNNSSTINNIYIDSDPYDDTVFSPKVHVIKDQTTHKNRVIFDVYKHQPGDQIFKLYHVELTGSPGQQASYRYFSKSDVTPSTDCLPNNPCYGTLVKPRGEMEDYRDETGHIKTAQYLLPLRINGSYGFRSEYVLDLYDNGTSSITTACSVEFRRKFYTASSCYINGIWYLQIKSFDPSALTDQVHLEWQVTWSTLAGSNTGYAVSGFLMDENKFYFTSSHINDRIFIVNRVSGQVSGYVIPDNGHAYINGRIEWYDDTYTSIVTGDNSAKHDMYLFNIKSNQYTVLSDNSPGVNWWDIAVSDKSILLVDKDSNYCHINIYNKQSKTWTTINQNDYGEEFGCCYGYEKFYVITPTHLVVIEDKTPYTIAKSYYVAWGNNNKVIRPTYCNGAVIVPCYNSQWLYVFNLKREMYSMMYLAWNTNTHEASRGNMCSPCAYRSYYFYPGGVSALYLNYMGNDKYNIGYKYAQYQISYNTESESSFEYDDAYVELTDACALISDGYQLYEVEEYDENHVTHIDVSKENYQFAYGFKLYKGDE